MWKLSRLRWLNCLDCKLSWSKHIDTTVTKMGRCMSMLRSCSAFLTALSTTVRSYRPFFVSHLDYCSVVWSNATKRDLGKLKLAQNRAARLALGCTQRANIKNMSISPGSKWRRDWLHQYVYLWEELTCWMHRVVCLNYWHPARTPMHTPQDMPPSSEQTMGGAQYYIEPWLHGTLFHSTT